MDNNQLKAVEPVVKKELDDLAREIDPDNEHDWYSLVLGWAIGKGYSIKQAQEISLHIRYDTPLC